VTARRSPAMTVGLIASPILWAVALAVILLSVRSLVLFASSADLFDLAAAIERGARPDADYLERFVASAGLDRVSLDCSDPYTRASLTVNLAALDAATAALDVARVDEAERAAIRAARHRLECNPLDGNAWLRYAMLETRAHGPAGPAIDALRLSYWTTPSESWIIEPRLDFASELRSAGAAGFEAEYLGDLRRFVSFEPVGRVASAYVATGAEPRGLLRDLIGEQPPARQKAIVAEIDRLGVGFSEAAR
jgi:hypothetical protein